MTMELETMCNFDHHETSGLQMCALSIIQHIDWQTNNSAIEANKE